MSLDSSLGLIAAEIALVLFILLLVSWILRLIANSRDKKAMKLLVKTIKDNKAVREQAIRGGLMQTGLEGAALEKTTIGILREEFRLYNRFINLYRKRDSQLAGQFNLDVENMLETFFSIDLNGSADEGDVETSSENAGTIKKLKLANKELQEELTITMETMGRMLEDYSNNLVPEEVEEPPVAVVDNEPEIETAELPEDDSALAATEDAEELAEDDLDIETADLPESEQAVSEEIVMEEELEIAAAELPEDDMTMVVDADDDFDIEMAEMPDDVASLTADLESAEDSILDAVDAASSDEAMVENLDDMDDIADMEIDDDDDEFDIDDVLFDAPGEEKK